MIQIFIYNPLSFCSTDRQNKAAVKNIRDNMYLTDGLTDRIKSQAALTKYAIQENNIDKYNNIHNGQIRLV